MKQEAGPRPLRSPPPIPSATVLSSSPTRQPQIHRRHHRPKSGRHLRQTGCWCAWAPAHTHRVSGLHQDHPWPAPGVVAVSNRKQPGISQSHAGSHWPPWPPQKSRDRRRFVPIPRPSAWWIGVEAVSNPKSVRWPGGLMLEEASLAGSPASGPTGARPSLGRRSAYAQAKRSCGAADSASAISVCACA